MSNPGNSNIITRDGGAMRIRSTQGAKGTSMVVTNQEIFSSPTTYSASTTATSYGVIACCPPSFAWLGTMCKNWQLYRFRKLRFLYSSRVPTTNAANVVIGHFSDVEDAYTWATTGTFNSLSYTEKSVSGPSWSSTLRQVGNRLTADMCLDIDCNQLHGRTNEFLIDPSPGTTVSANQSVPLWLAWSVQPSGTLSQVVGAITVEYEVEFFKPTPADSNTGSLLSRFSNNTTMEDKIPLRRFEGREETQSPW